jgi:hypothetical protein
VALLLGTMDLLAPGEGPYESWEFLLGLLCFLFAALLHLLAKGRSNGKGGSR